MKQSHFQLGVVAGRILLASLFILGGVNKLLNYGDTLATMQEAGLPLTAILLPLTILLELGGGLIVAVGRLGSRAIALVLAGYTLLVNVIFHPFWAIEGPDRVVQLSLFFKNISIVGGLLIVAANAKSIETDGVEHGARNS